MIDIAKTALFTREAMRQWTNKNSPAPIHRGWAFQRLSDVSVFVSS